MKYEISEHIITPFLSELFNKSQESFIDIDYMRVSQDSFPLFDKSNGLSFKPQSDSSFILLYKEKHIPIKYYTIDIRSAGFVSKVNITTTDTNKDVIQDFLNECFNFTVSQPFENMITTEELYSNFWLRNDPMCIQTIDHLYLPKVSIDGLKERISKFSSQRERYIKFGKAYKLNIMLSGVPGSGKTSLVKAIAHFYKKRLYVMQLNKDSQAKNIQTALKMIVPNSILLIEDIDSYFKGRDTKDSGLSFSTFLNILDGVSGQHNGLITFVTANFPEDLDKAVIRPGRVDHICHFDYPKRAEIKESFFDLVQNATDELFATFYSSIKEYKIPMSGIVDYLFLFGETNESIIKNIEHFICSQQFIRSNIDKDITEKIYN